MAKHAHTLWCLFACPEKKPKPPKEKFPTPHDLHRRHREEDRNR